MNNRDQLRINGYAVDASGGIELHRQPHDRYAAHHCAIIQLTAGDAKVLKDLSAQLITAIDEPGVLVGTSRNRVVLLFKMGSCGTTVAASAGYDTPRADHEFVFDGKQGMFTATAQGTIDVGAWTWRDNRSPVTIRRDFLPELWLSTSQSAYNAIDAYLSESDGRWGPLVVPESDFERSVRERIERGAAGVIETPIDADAELVARNPDLSSSDGIFGMLVHQARKRIMGREVSKS